jgi:hypothetical protein
MVSRPESVFAAAQRLPVLLIFQVSRSMEGT